MNIKKQVKGKVFKMVRYHGIRLTDPYGWVGLQNPERGFRIEALIAQLPVRGERKLMPRTLLDTCHVRDSKGELQMPLDSMVTVLGSDAEYAQFNQEDVIEMHFDAHHLRDKVIPVYDDHWWILNAEHYEPFGLSLAQTYCYLIEFRTKPISQEKLELLQKSFDNLRRYGLKVILIFANQAKLDKRGGPELKWILKHIEQLEPIIRKNADIINVMPVGFVGAWGEWHRATHIKWNDYAAQAEIVKKVLEVLPVDRMTQLRVPKYKRHVLTQSILNSFEVLSAEHAHTAIPVARIGFCNYGFLAGATDGGTWEEKPYFGNPGNPEFDYMTHESPYVPVDGEFFFRDLQESVSGLRAAVRMRLHHYNSFSLEHGYSSREGMGYTIDRWMNTSITAEQLLKAKMPISDGYFEDSFGNEVKRREFEYIRDHLGYRLELQQARFPANVKANDELVVEVELINRGFSVMHNPRPVYFVLIGVDGNVLEFHVKNADPRKWQPFEPGDEDYKALRHKINLKAKLPSNLQPGWYSVGLWLPDGYESLRFDKRYAVRVANRDVVWWTDSEDRFGINVLGLIEVEK